MSLLLLLLCSMVLGRHSDRCPLLIDFWSLSPSYPTFITSHLLLDSLDISVGIVSLGQVLFFESLHLVLPHLENITLYADVVSGLGVTPESLIVSAVERAQASSQHAFNDHWNCNARFFPLSRVIVKAELASIVGSPHVAIALDCERSRVPRASLDHRNSLLCEYFDPLWHFLTIKIGRGKTELAFLI